MVAVASTGIFTSSRGLSHTLRDFIEPINRDLEIIKALVDRIGVRETMIVVATMLDTASILFGAVGNLLWPAMGFARLPHARQSQSRFATRFSRKRGYAMGLMPLGLAVSRALHPVLGQWLPEVPSRQTWTILGLVN